MTNAVTDTTPDNSASDRSDNGEEVILSSFLLQESPRHQQHRKEQENAAMMMTSQAQPPNDPAMIESPSNVHTDEEDDDSLFNETIVMHHNTTNHMEDDDATALTMFSSAQVSATEPRSEPAVPASATTTPVVNNTVGLGSSSTSSSQNQQTRFSFYNAEDFVMHSNSGVSSKSPKHYQNRQQMHGNSPRVETEDEQQQNMHQRLDSSGSTGSSGKRVYNFYDPTEVKLTQTVIETVQQQESTAQDNNMSSTDAPDSIEILKSLQEHEQQRLEILGGGAFVAPASSRIKTSTSSDNSHTEDHVNYHNTIEQSDSGGNPYEDAIKEALELLRKHRGPTHSQAPRPPPQDYNHSQPSSIQFQTGGLHPTLSWGDSGGNDHVESSGSVATVNTPHSDTTLGTGLLGDAYQAEIEARRRQRQERMARYANRLAELKQQEIMSSTTTPAAATTATRGVQRAKSENDGINNSLRSSKKDDQGHSWDVHSGRYSNYISRSYSEDSQEYQDNILAFRSPPDSHDNENNYQQQQQQQLRTSASHASYVSQEQEIQLGVERVLLAILQRANSATSSQGRGRMTAITTATKLTHVGSTVPDGLKDSNLTSNTSYLQDDEKKSANPDDTTFLRGQFTTTGASSGGHVGDDRSLFQQYSYTSSEGQQDIGSSSSDEKDALLRALSDLLGPSSTSTTRMPPHATATAFRNSNNDHSLRQTMMPADGKYYTTSVDDERYMASTEQKMYSASRTYGHSSEVGDDQDGNVPDATAAQEDERHNDRYDTILSRIEHEADANGQIAVVGGLSSPQHVLVDTYSRDGRAVHSHGSPNTGGKKCKRVTDVSMEDEHLELDRMVEHVFASDSKEELDDTPLHEERYHSTDRYHVGNQANDDSFEYREHDNSNSQFHSNSESNEYTSSKSRSKTNLTASSKYDNVDDDKNDYSQSHNSSSRHNEGSTSRNLDPSESHETDDEDESDSSESADDVEFHFAVEEESPNSKINRHDTGGVLGPLSKRSGGTTGVVLEHDDSSAAASSSGDGSSGVFSSSSSALESDEDDDGIDKHGNNHASNHGSRSQNSASSPTLFESLTAAVSLVTGVTSYEGEKSPPVPPVPTGASGKDKYYFEKNHRQTDDYDPSDDAVDTDDSSDLEAYDLMRSLCAHLLPFGVDSMTKGGSGRRLLDPLPEWDESNPDEPGYRIVRLNNYQLRRVQRAFEKMVDEVKANSHRNLSALDKSGSDEMAFERDLKEAEDLLDEEEKRLVDSYSKSLPTDSKKHSPLQKGPSSTSVSAKHTKNRESSPSGSSAAQSDVSVDNDLSSAASSLTDFHGVKPVGKGEMGDMEYFSLPIIFKSHVTGFEPTKDLILEPGNIIAGKYMVEGALGSAAFSTAYKCVNLNADVGDDHERYVCLKVIKNTKDFFDQSLDEIKILELLRQTGKCQEKNLVEMFSFFYHREHLVIVTELLRQNLFEFGKFIIESGEEPYFTIPRLGYITRQCLIALDFVHKLGLVHSDIKPENILLASYSRALIKIIDFGSSCWLTDRQSSYIQSRSYRAPEVVLGLPYDGRIDVWSLGCVVAEMFTGEVTFQNDSIVSMLSRIEAICGPFPRHMIAQGRQSPRFFTTCGLLFERVPTDGDDDKDDSYSDDDINNISDDERLKLTHIDIFQPKKTTLSKRLGFESSASSADTSFMDKLLSKAQQQQHYFFSSSNGGTTDEQKKRQELMFVDFIRKLLTIDPEVRLTCEQALRHPFMLYAATLTEADIKYPS